MIFELMPYSLQHRKGKRQKTFACRLGTEPSQLSCTEAGRKRSLLAHSFAQAACLLRDHNSRAFQLLCGVQNREHDASFSQVPETQDC